MALLCTLKPGGQSRFIFDIEMLPESGNSRVRLRNHPAQPINSRCPQIWVTGVGQKATGVRGDLCDQGIDEPAESIPTNLSQFPRSSSALLATTPPPLVTTTAHAKGCIEPVAPITQT